MPGEYSLIQMGEIVDFIVLPANREGFKVMAVDADGDLMYCQPGKLPQLKTLTVPDGGWGAIEHIIYADKWLYVIDPAKNDVWVYKTDRTSQDVMDNIVFDNAPESFFGDESIDIGGAVGTILNQDDLYIIHEDGHMSLCHYGLDKERDTTCDDPAPFTDDRVSSENHKPWIFMGTNFIAIENAQLPGNAIYLLDKISATIYRFSM